MTTTTTSTTTTTAAATAPHFADTVPLWFRSEAFAEDLADAVHAPSGLKPASPFNRPGYRLLRVDSHVLAAGASVLRQTVQALKLQRW